MQLFLLFTAALAACAHAHFMAIPNVGPSGGFFTANFYVGHGATKHDSYTRVVTVDIPAVIRDNYSVRPVAVPGFTTTMDMMNIISTVEDHGMSRNTTVSRVTWTADPTVEGPYGIHNDMTQSFSIMMKLPCWCTITEESVHYCRPNGTALPAIYFRVAQTITLADDSTMEMVWDDKPINSDPINWNKRPHPMPVVYMDDSIECPCVRPCHMDKENGDDGDSTIVVETNARRYEYSAENIFTAMIIVVLVAGVIIFLAMFTYFRSKRMVQTVPASTATFELADGQYQKTAEFA